MEAASLAIRRATHRIQAQSGLCSRPGVPMTFAEGPLLSAHLTPCTACTGCRPCVSSSGTRSLTTGETEVRLLPACKRSAIACVWKELAAPTTEHHPAAPLLAPVWEDGTHLLFLTQRFDPAWRCSDMGCTEGGLRSRRQHSAHHTRNGWRDCLHRGHDRLL